MDKMILAGFMKKAQELGLTEAQANEFLKQAVSELTISDKSAEGKAEDVEAMDAAKKIVEHEKKEIVEAPKAEVPKVEAPKVEEAPKDEVAKVACYIEGFAKRANELDIHPLVTIELLKTAFIKSGFDTDSIMRVLRYNPELVDALIGGGVGGAAGAMVPSKDEEGNTHHMRNAVLGALLGGGAGAAAGHFAPNAIPRVPLPEDPQGMGQLTPDHSMMNDPRQAMQELGQTTKNMAQHPGSLFKSLTHGR